MEYIQFQKRFINKYEVYIPRWGRDYLENAIKLSIIADSVLECTFIDDYLNEQQKNRFNIKLEDIYEEYRNLDVNEFDSQTSRFMVEYFSEIENFVKTKNKELEIYKEYIDECPYTKICFEIRHVDDCNKKYLMEHPFVSRGDYRIFFNVYENELNKYIPINHNLMNKWDEDIEGLYDIAALNQSKLFDYRIEPVIFLDNKEVYLVNSNSAYNLCHVFSKYSPTQDISNEIGENLYIFQGEDNNFSGAFVMIPESNKEMCSTFIDLCNYNKKTDYMYYTCKNGINKLAIGEEEIKDLKALLNDYIIDASERFLESGINDMNDTSVEKLQKTDVPNDVKEHIRQYFNESSGLENYEFVEAQRSSNHPDDIYLYEVIGKNINNGKYAVWTRWNESTQCLNCGHYNLDTLAEAIKVADEYYYDFDRESINNTKVL